MRQSAGKTVKNRLAATCFAQQPIGATVAVGWAARIRNPVLLKTASHAHSAVWPQAGRQLMQRTKYSRRFPYYATRVFTLVVVAG